MIKRYAAIYIGSIKCEMVVGQRGKGTVSILDRTAYPLDFGKQSFNVGSIRFQSVYQLCRIINEYIEIAKGYDAEEIEIIGTSALREASNRFFLMEQIRSYTGGYGVKLLEKEEETELSFRFTMMKAEGDLLASLEQGDSVMAHLSSGSFAIARLTAGLIDDYRTSPMGYLRIREILKGLEEYSDNYGNMLSDYIANNMATITKSIRASEAKHLIISSHDAEAIANLCGIQNTCTFYRIERQVFEALYEDVKQLDAKQILRKYPVLDKAEAETVKMTLVVILKLLDDVSVDKVDLIPLNICDALVNFKFNLSRDESLVSWIQEGTYASVRKLSEKYGVDSKHAQATEKFAIKMFDALRKRYKFPERDRFLLRMAARLMDIGSFVGIQKEGINLAIMQSTDIVGLSEKEKMIIGYILDSLEQPSIRETFPGIKNKAGLTVAYLTSILKLAEALDVSHHQKISKISCSVKDTRLYVKVKSSWNIQIEAYFFEQDARILEDVLGVIPTLQIKREII